ncbi:hypothetical protein QUB80_14250 [Chlorogloeopsis sp. ULAP01]|nr:hypothetical protein [Chlorogloeopsis sp. ULAP01]
MKKTKRHWVLVIRDWEEDAEKEDGGQGQRSRLMSFLHVSFRVL